MGAVETWRNIGSEPSDQKNSRLSIFASRTPRNSFFYQGRAPRPRLRWAPKVILRPTGMPGRCACGGGYFGYQFDLQTRGALRPACSVL